MKRNYNILRVLIFVVLFCLSPFFNPIKSHAAVITKSIVNDTNVRVRTGAGTNFSIMQANGGDLKLNTGHSVRVLNDVPNAIDTNCDSRLWKNIEFTYNGTLYNGYMCADYITTTVYEEIDDVDFDAYLVSSGFPESYWPALKELHAAHPNWKFKAVHTGIKWKHIIDNQSFATGKSLIQTTNDGWKHIDSYNYDTNTFRNDYPGGGKSWYAASRDIVAYYVDPRNFLSEISVFMFETAALDPVNHTLQGVEGILKGTWMENKIVEGTNKTYAEVLMEVANEVGASPYFLASRIIQELGRNSPSSIISGTVKGYEGYYNYYNINATGSSNPEEIIANGLTYAKNRDWNTRYKAILGGAEWIVNGYINIGQDTLYNQKWDIVGDLYSHQYMQNIQAPAGEVGKIYSAYSKSNLLGSEFIFNIPVYLEMPSTASPLPRKENPIAYLSSLSINNNALGTFNYDKDTYNYTVALGTSTIDIKATPKISGASVAGTGIINLDKDVTTIEIVVTALNGNTKTYKIIVTKSGEVNANIDEIMINSGVKYNSSHIWGLELGMSSNALIDKIKNVNSNATISIVNKTGAPKGGNHLSTGDKMLITLNDETKSYEVIIYGDVSGDGEITVLDLLRVQKHILGSAVLDKGDTYYKAADVSGDGEITVLDLLRVQKHILGSSRISQL